MLFNDLLAKEGIRLDEVLALRHTPPERELKKILPWLARAKPDVFNAYQQTQQSEQVEACLGRAKYVASFLGEAAGKGLFVGLYRVGSHRPLTYDEYWRVPAYQEMKKFGMKGFVQGHRESILWFDMEITEF